ncbi:PilZ domain-containing protein [Pseudomonas lopnurensis]|uniref:PilZ domain-containing protein n=1 Tax=Pseudomonas lopnurensis TaxID=1477517 RepID=UPI0028AF9894|nr:PilZ domain-containing protein [Pseudomonas lopnurensis]
MSQNERDYSEKRDFIRMQLETGVTLEHSDTKLSGTCIDLSSTGMQIVARTDLQLGDRVRVLIPSEHSELEGLDAQTEVVRVSRLDDGRQRLGLAILAMS